MIRNPLNTFPFYYIKERYFLIFAICLSAFFIRIWGIEYDISSQPNPDGNLYIENALKVVSGQINIGLFRQGNFYPYFLSICFGGLFLVERLLGIVKSPDDFLILNYIANPANLLIYTRFISAVLGVIIVYLTYIAGKRLFDAYIGLISSFFVAFSYIHVQQSHYEKEDMLTSILIIIALLFAISIIKKDKPSLFDFVFCGGFIGLATASKYLAWVGISLFLFACLYHRRTPFFRRYTLLGMLFIPVGFLVGEPFALLDFNRFISDISSMKTVTELGLDLNGQPRWLFYLTEHLKNGIGLPLEVIVLLASIYMIFKRYWLGLILLVYPISLLIFLNYYKAHCSYYLVTAIPFIAILSGWFLNELSQKIKEDWLKNTAVIISAVFIIIPSLINCIRLDYLLSQPSTGELAKEWIERNIPTNSQILIEGTYGSIIAGGPALNSNIESMRRELEGIQAKGGKGKLWEKKIEFIRQNKEIKTYDIIKTTNLTAKLIEETNPICVISKSVYDYDNGYRITSSAERKAMHKLLNEKYRLIKRVEPYPVMDDTPYLYLMDFNKLKMVELLVSPQREIIQGIGINIYERRENGI